MKKTLLLSPLLFAAVFTACEEKAPLEGVEPDVDFSFEVNTETLEVKFSGKSENAQTYRWEFGDEQRGVSNEKDPVYTYDKAGTYDVTLTVTNGDFSSEVTKSVPVQKVPVAAFSYTTDGNTGTVTFTNESTDAVSYKWDFGDGKGTSTEESPVYTYDATGSYTVTLTAISVDLESTAEQTVKVTVIPPEADFDFTADIQTGKVTFTNKSTNASSYKWSFGDELNGSSEDKDPVYTYRKPGTYTVTLTASAGSRSDETSKEITLTAPEGVELISIIADGNPDDWAEIPAIEGDWGQPVSPDVLSWGTEITGMKTAMTENYLYVLISGTSQIQAANLAETKIFIDVDNDLETGEKMSPWVQDDTMGGDVMFYNGSPWPYYDGGYGTGKTFPVEFVFIDGNDGTTWYKELSISMKDLRAGFETTSGLSTDKTSETIRLAITLNTNVWRPVGTPADTEDLTLVKLPPLTVEKKYVEWK